MGKKDLAMMLKFSCADQQLSQEPHDGPVDALAGIANRKNSLVLGADGKPVYSNNTLRKTAGTAVARGVSSVMQGDQFGQNLLDLGEAKVGIQIAAGKQTLNSLLKLTSTSLQETNLFTQYFDVLQALDIFGVTNALTSASSFMAAKKERDKLDVLEAQKIKYAQKPEYTPELHEVVLYALNKVKISYITTMAKAVLQALQAVMRWITLGLAGLTAPITEAVKLAAALVEGCHTVYRNLKGVFKFLKGTKGINRKHYAGDVFDLVAAGNPDAISFLTDLQASQRTLTDEAIIKIVKSAFDSRENDPSTLRLLVTSWRERGLAGLFKAVQDNQQDEKVKFIKSSLVDGIAQQFKSQGAAPTTALAQEIYQMATS